MRITFSNTLSRNETSENNAFSVTAKFWDDSAETWTASTPTTVRYRIDNLDDANQVLDWTSASASSSVSITVPYTATDIACQSRYREYLQLTVMANAGLSSQYQDVYKFSVRNLVGQS